MDHLGVSVNVFQSYATPVILCWLKMSYKFYELTKIEKYYCMIPFFINHIIMNNNVCSACYEITAAISKHFYEQHIYAVWLLYLAAWTTIWLAQHV